MAKAEVGVDDLDVTEHFLARQPDAFEMVRVELQAVAHAQHFAGLLAGIEHALRSARRKSPAAFRRTRVCRRRRRPACVPCAARSASPRRRCRCPGSTPSAHVLVVVDDLSGKPYFFCHSAAFDGVPVTMPARRQLRVFCSAGAIWLVERLPRPHSATPNLRPAACALPMLLSSGRAARAAVRVRNWRRSVSDMADP